MKWSELSFKERKQVYDNIRSQNPKATYFDIKQQFDSIPEYEDGGKKLPENITLPPEFTVGTPEYFKRQAAISGRVTAVQPEAYLTPAGYIKDAINFVEDLGKGDYTGAAVDALLNAIPWGVGKTLKNIKRKVSKVNGSTQELHSYATPFAPTITKKGKKVKTEADYDSEFSEVQRKHRNMSNYEKEISSTINDAVYPDSKTYQLLNQIDADYGTNYKKAYSNIAYQDMTNRGKYVSWGEPEKGGFGVMNVNGIEGNALPNDIKNYKVMLDNSTYMPGTANHELGHVADGIAGSTRYFDDISGKDYITNPYLRYLADPANTFSERELIDAGFSSAARNKGYLLNPTEAKAHMLTLKRALKNSGKITNWSDTVDEKMIKEYLKSSNANNAVRDQYRLYRDKQAYIDRINKLVPMEIVTPVGAAGFAGYELSNENK